MTQKKKWTPPLVRILSDDERDRHFPEYDSVKARPRKLAGRS